MHSLTREYARAELNEDVAFAREAQKRLDWQMMAEATYYYSRSLGLFNQPEMLKEAISMSQRIWEMVGTERKLFLVDVAVLLAKQNTQIGDFTTAIYWINRGNELLAEAHKEGSYSSHIAVDLLYCEAEIHFKTQYYEKAQKLYEKALHKATELGWKRAKAYIQGWLGAIALEQDQTTEAKQLLQSVVPIAIKNNDQRCLAIWQTTVLKRLYLDLIA